MVLWGSLCAGLGAVDCAGLGAVACAGDKSNLVVATWKEKICAVSNGYFLM